MIDENKIIARSSELYLRYGFKSVSIDDVAFMLGVSKKTLYEHIENKNRLIQKVVENNLNDFFDTVITKIDNEADIFKSLCIIFFSTVENVKRTNPSYIHDLKKYYNLEYKKIIEFRDKRLYKTFKDCLKKGIESGLIREDIDIQFAFFSQISKVSIFFLESEFEYAERIPVQRIYKMILNDIRGITTLKGHEVLDTNYNTLLQLSY